MATKDTAAAPAGPVRVLLGNRDARNLITVALEQGRARHADDTDPALLHSEDPETGTAVLSDPVPGKKATLATVPEGTRLGDAFTTVTAGGQGIWAQHTHGEGCTPAWVASDSPGLAALLAEHYGCPVRDLDEDELAATFGVAV